MPSKKTTKTSAKWSDDVFEEFIASGMKLEDLLDEDIQSTDYSWHQMRRLCDVYHIRTGGGQRRHDQASPPSLWWCHHRTRTSVRGGKRAAQICQTAGQAIRCGRGGCGYGGRISEGERNEAEHQREIIDINSKIDQLKQDFARELEETFDILKSPNEKHPVNIPVTGVGGGFIGFYNLKQNLWSWCTDGHPDKHRFRKNGWNPVYFADTKEDIVKWVMQQPALTTSPTGEGILTTGTNPDERTDDETPIDRGISRLQPDQARSLATSQAKRSWGSALDKLKETARQLGINTAAKDPTRWTLNFEEELDDASAAEIQQSTDGTKVPAEQRKGIDHRFDTFRPDSGQQTRNLRTTNDPETAFAAGEPRKQHNGQEQLFGYSQNNYL
jgi:hypothetical protein